MTGRAIRCGVPASPPAPPPPLADRLRQVASSVRTAGGTAGTAVLVGTFTRVWQLAAGLVTFSLIGTRFSPELQGLYTAFGGLLAMQTLFDLGLTGVLVSLSTREWSAALDEPDDSPRRDLARRRLGTLLRGGQRWFASFGALFLLVVAPVGLLWLDEPAIADVDWRAAWLAAVALTAASVVLMPAVGLLEGRFVVAVNLFRLAQAVLGNAVVWTMLLTGCGIWVVVGSAAVRLLCEGWLVLRSYRPLLTELRTTDALPDDDELSWRGTVQPLQWRIALQSAAGYFATQVYAPIIYKLDSVAESGRIGMTWPILVAIQSAALLWLQARLPQLGQLVAERRFAEARGILRVTVAAAVATLACGAAALVGLVIILHAVRPPLAERLLDVPTILIFAVSLTVQAVLVVWIGYVRLHRIDPFVRPSLIGSATLSLGVVVGALLAGSRGIALAHLLTMVCLNVPLLRPVFRRELAVVETDPTERSDG